MKRQYLLVLAMLAYVFNASFCFAGSSSSSLKNKQPAVKEMPNIANEAEYAEWVKKNEKASQTSSNKSASSSKSSGSSKTSAN